MQNVVSDPNFKREEYAAVWAGLDWIIGFKIQPSSGLDFFWVGLGFYWAGFWAGLD